MSSRTIATWAVPLDGHVFDFEDLPIYMDGSAIQVKKSANGYQLELPASIAGFTHDKVMGLAAAFVDLMNGAASLVHASYRPVAIADGAFFGLDESGSVVNTVLKIQSAEMRCKAGHLTMLVNGIAQQDARLGQITRIVEATEKNVGARDALGILGRSSPSWSELYVTYELVQANAGDRMYTANWISRAQGTLFARTANSYTALGRASRHGKQTAEPPSEPMTQKDATALMRALVAAWLSSIHSESTSAS